MGASVTRRMEIRAEIARLGKQQKETARGIMSAGRRSPKGDASYDERARRIAELVLELAGLDGVSPTRNSENTIIEKKAGTVRLSGLRGHDSQQNEGDREGPNVEADSTLTHNRQGSPTEP